MIALFNGKIFLNVFCANIKELNNFEQTIIGLVITGFISQIINFFFPLKNLLIYLNISIILFYILLNLIKNKKFQYLFSYTSVPFLFLIFVNIYGSLFSDDLHHYHLGSIINSDNHNYIVGLNSLHSLYGFSSVWLSLHSYFNFDYSRLQDIHILNGIILFLFLSFLFFEIIKEIKKKNETLYLPILFFFLIFVLTKYTRLKEFGIDRPAFLIFFYIILFYFKHIILNISNQISEKYRVNILLLLFFFCTFVFFIKIIFVFSLILPITLFFTIKNKLLIFKNPLTYLLFLIYLLYFIKNLLISGCLIYPVQSLCITNLTWYEMERIKILNFNTEVFNKSFFQYLGNLTQVEYIKNFNWLKSWADRNSHELFEFLSLLCVIFLVTLLNFKKSVYSSYKIKKIELFSLATICFFSLLLVFLKTPVIRMSHHIFVLFCFILFLTNFNQRFFLINKKIFFLLIFIFFTFNISKNLIRIKNTNFINDPIYVLKKAGFYNKPDKKNLNGFVYYQGWIDGHPIGNANLDNYLYKKWFIFDIISKSNY